MKYLELFEKVKKPASPFQEIVENGSVEDIVIAVLNRLGNNLLSYESNDSLSSLTIWKGAIFSAMSSNYFKIINNFGRYLHNKPVAERDGRYISILDGPTSNQTKAVFRSEQMPEVYAKMKLVYQKLKELFSEYSHRKVAYWINFLLSVDKAKRTQLYIYIDKSNVLWHLAPNKNVTVMLEFLVDETFDVEDLSPEERFKLVDYINNLKKYLTSQDIKIPETFTQKLDKLLLDNKYLVRGKKSDMWNYLEENSRWMRSEGDRRKTRMKHLKTPKEYVSDNEKYEYQVAKNTPEYRKLIKSCKDVTTDHDKAKGIFRFYSSNFKVKYSVDKEYFVYFKRPKTIDTSCFQIKYATESYKEAFASIIRSKEFLDRKIAYDYDLFQGADELIKGVLLKQLWDELSIPKIKKDIKYDYDKSPPEKIYVEEASTQIANLMALKECIPSLDDVSDKLRPFLIKIYDFIEQLLLDHPMVFTSISWKPNRFGVVTAANQLNFLANFPKDLVDRIDWEAIFDKIDDNEVVSGLMKELEKRVFFSDMLKKYDYITRSNKASLWEFK